MIASLRAGCISAEPTEQYCSSLVDKADADIPEACKKYASVKAKLEAKNGDPFLGMTPGAQAAVRSAQVKRRMSTRHGQGAQGQKKSWF